MNIIFSAVCDYLAGCQQTGHSMQFQGNGVDDINERRLNHVAQRIVGDMGCSVEQCVISHKT